MRRRVRQSRIPLAAFKELVRKEALGLLEVNPRGFGHDDLAIRIGEGFENGGVEERRLRRQIANLCNIGLLYGVDRGVFIAGPNADLQGAQTLSFKIHSAFRENGGCMAMEDLRQIVGCSESNARRSMRASGRYYLGIPLEGYKRWWFMNDEERYQIPLPGTKQLLELQIIALRGGQPLAGKSLITALARLRKRVGLALRDARELRGQTPEDLVAIPEVSRSVINAFEKSDCVTIADPALSNRHHTAGIWWAAAKLDFGESQALVEVLRRLEGSNEKAPSLLEIMSAEAWIALGNALGVQAALLSRGCVVGTCE